MSGATRFARTVKSRRQRKNVRVVVIGGGNAGLSVAGRLRREGVADVVVIEPREQHVYAPLQSHIAGGVARASEAVRRQADVTPRGVRWIRDRVVSVDPVARSVTLESGESLSFDHLVIATGIDMRWDAVPGLEDAMRAPEGVSNYSYELAAKASPVLRDLRAGTVVFVQPAEPASAGGVAQKPMYLACDWWRRTGVLDDIRVLFVTAQPTAFPVPAVADELHRKIGEYGIEARYGSDLASVDADARKVVIDRDGQRETVTYDALHVAPPQAAAPWIAASGLGDEAGFVAVDATMQHPRFPQVWSLGDAAGVSTLRSGGAIRRQAKVLAKNLLSAMAGREPVARYGGYSVCPITVSRRTVVFAEFDGSRQLAPTVPGWRSLYRERRLTCILDRHVLPWVYWHLILQGRA
jgi:sulfide:quinone oxidoreductase